MACPTARSNSWAYLGRPVCTIFSRRVATWYIPAVEPSPAPGFLNAAGEQWSGPVSTPTTQRWRCSISPSGVSR